ncbi:L-threonylcarbamoyladenylate synthase [Pararhizobium sp. LjRoot255]|uniref:L-threonylcarbamoyladenylate synthase n=1 Tax=Pararhizobium sp. LjRoot255 TaxID=3342298 RepID=UPI003ECFE83E
MTLIIDTRSEPERALAVACETLAKGLPVAIPTETVYGLAADATNPDAISRIYEMKGRPRFNPLICHVADFAMARCYVDFDPISLKLAQAFWPGPLTLILPMKPRSGVHPLASAGLDTLGIRMPEGFSRAVIKRYGKPLAAPSANTSGKISPTSAEHVATDLGGKLALILDAGPAEIGLESTIIKVDGDEIRLLRPGGLDVADIEKLTGKPVLRSETAGAAIEAPGMLASHYAPGAAVRLNAADVKPGEALIRFGGAALPGEEKAAVVLDLSPSASLREAAANLFAYMKKADACGATTIAFGPIPSVGLGEAIIDRIERAAAPRDIPEAAT